MQVLARNYKIIKIVRFIVAGGKALFRSLPEREVRKEARRAGSEGTGGVRQRWGGFLGPIPCPEARMLLKSLALEKLVSSDHLSLTQMLSSIAGGSPLDQGWIGVGHPSLRFAHSICVS